MIRFVDLRNQDTGYKFAFWDTVTDSFVSVSGGQAWNTYDEFEEDCRTSALLKGDHGPAWNMWDFTKLCPEWAFQLKQIDRMKYNQYFKRLIHPEPTRTYSFKDISFVVCDPAKTERCQIPFALSKKLYDQNAAKYTQRYRIPGYSTQFHSSVCFAPPRTHISATMTAIDKYTIVGLTYDDKHYQGLTSRAACDKENSMTGIAIAYNRAFEKMMDAQDVAPRKPHIEDLKSFKEMCNKWPGVFKAVDKNTPSYRELINAIKVNEHHQLVEKISELIHELIHDVIAAGKEPTEILIKPAASNKLRKELEIQYCKMVDTPTNYHGLKYTVDPSIHVDVIII